MYKVKLSFFLFFCSLQSCQIVSEKILHNKYEIFYMANKGENVDLFDVKEKLYLSVNKAYLADPNNRNIAGEFSGSFEFCSNEEFYCLNRRIFVAIPKKMEGRTQWNFHGYACKIEELFLEEKLISCTTVNNLVTTILYSSHKGIIGYKNSWMGIGFDLISDNGLFSN